MTGITKDELMQMAEGSGVFHCASKFGFHSDAFNTSLEYLTNAILERAAARCDSKARLLSNVDCEGAHDRVIAARELAVDIRALKINTGDLDEQD